MLKRIALLGGLTLLIGVAVVPAAHASTPLSLSVQIGSPVAVAPYAVAPRAPRGYVWQPGYYTRTPYGNRWVPGAWVPAPYSRGDVRGYRDDEWREHRGGDRDEHWRGDRDDHRDWDRDRR